MEAVIFIGMQATGKSTFFKERFADTHVRINLDMLRTRHREDVLLAACVSAKQSFVVDNTNCTRAERGKYIPPARAAGFQVVGYYFQSNLEECQRRNARRPKAQRVPLPGLLGAHGRLERPDRAEGFDRIYYVSITPQNTFAVEEWHDEIR